MRAAAPPRAPATAAKLVVSTPKTLKELMMTKRRTVQRAMAERKPLSAASMPPFSRAPRVLLRSQPAMIQPAKSSRSAPPTLVT